MQSEERVMRAREVRDPREIVPAIEIWFFKDLGETQRRQLINICGFPGVEANGHDLQLRLLRQILGSIPQTAFSDEGSGIGEGRGPLSRAEKDAVLAYMERHCPHRAKETAWDAVSAFNAIFAAIPSDIDRSGLAQEVEQSRGDQLLADDLDYVAGKPVE